MNKSWKRFIIVVSALMAAIIICVSINVAVDSITGSILPQSNAGAQQNGGMNSVQNDGAMQQNTPDAGFSQGGDSMQQGTLSGGTDVTPQTPSNNSPQQGGSNNAQTPQQNTSNSPLSYNKSQLISYYNSCLKKSYSQKLNATKTEQVDVKPSGVDIGSANFNVDKIADALIANNTKNNGVVQTKSFVNGKATDDGSPIEKFVLPANLYDAAVKSITIKQNGQGYQIVIVLNEETCAHNGTAKYNASCAWPLDVGVINFKLPGFGNAVDIQQCTFRYTGTKITAMIDSQGRVTDTKVEMPLTVTNAVAKAVGITIKVAKIEGKWTCVNSMRFA